MKADQTCLWGEFSENGQGHLIPPPKASGRNLTVEQTAEKDGGPLCTLFLLIFVENFLLLMQINAL